MSKKYRLIIQLIVFAVIVLFVFLIYYNTNANLDAINQSFNFDFLHNRAGFAIGQTLIPYTENNSYWRVFWVGLLNTLLVSFLAIITATILGVSIGILRLSTNWLVRKLATCYIDLFRNIPLLLQLFFWFASVLLTLSPARTTQLFFGCDGDSKENCLLTLSNRGLNIIQPHWNGLAQIALALIGIGIILSIVIYYFNHRRHMETGKYYRLWWLYIGLIIIIPAAFYLLNMQDYDYSAPSLKGFNYSGGLSVLPELIALWIALTLYSAAYIAEYVRSGIQSVDKGQTEAALALGMNNGLLIRLIILPQALRVIIPPLTNQYLNIIKNSSLATAIAYPDLVSVFTGTALNQTGHAIEIIFMTMLVYLLISLTIALVMNYLNRRFQFKVR